MKKSMVFVWVVIGLAIVGSFFYMEISGKSVDINNGLVAHYEFENNFDDSVPFNYHSGISQGEVKFVDGKIGKAIDLGQAVDNYFKVESHSALTGESTTLSAWIYARDSTKSEIISKWNLRLKQGGWRLFIENSNGQRFVGFQLGGATFCKSSVSFVYNGEEQWDLITASFDDSTKKMKIYLNGELKQEITASSCSAGDNMEDLLIGQYFDGKIDDVRIYDRALSDTEVKRLYTTAQ